MSTYSGTRVCGVSDSLGGVACLWPRLDVKVYVHANAIVGGASLYEAATKAIEVWNKVCGIRLSITQDPQNANIVMNVAHLDGPGKVLADSQLPCFGSGRPYQLVQRYDNSEAYVISVNPPANKLDLVRVVAHELGHAIGIGHLQGNGSNLMDPTYSDRISDAQEGDIKEAIFRYGKPRATPTTPDLIPSPTDPESDINAPDIIKTVLPCLIKYAPDIINELTPEERRTLIRTGIAWWRKLGPKSQQELLEKVSE